MSLEIQDWMSLHTSVGTVNQSSSSSLAPRTRLVQRRKATTIAHNTGHTTPDAITSEGDGAMTASDIVGCSEYLRPRELNAILRQC